MTTNTKGTDSTRTACPGALMNKGSWLGVLAALVVIAAVALCYFYPDAMEGNVLRQHDMQQGTAIGQETKLYFEQTGEQSHWTNGLFGGMPTFQISPTYPSSTLFSWINSVFGLWLPAPANLLAMMMIGFFILLMTMRMRWYVALMGAIAYGLSSYFVIIIGAGHIWKFITLAYVPPTIAGVVLCYRGRYLLGGALTALFGMMQLLSNHPQMTYYFLFVTLGFAVAYLVDAVRNKGLRQWGIATGVLVVAGVLAVGANLPSLYNTYEYSKETMRGRHSELTQPAAEGAQAASSSKGLDRDYILQYSYGRGETLSLMIPNVKGGGSIKPVAGGMKALTLADLPDAQSLYTRGEISAQDAQNLGAFMQYFGEPEMTNGPVYVGALVVALFLLGCFIVRGPLKWVLLVLTLLSVFLALGRNMAWLSDLFINYFPMYSKFRTVESILVIAEFTMPLLAMMAVHRFFTTDNPWQRYGRQVVWSFGFCLLICAIGIVAPGAFGDYLGAGEEQYKSYVQQMPVLFAAVEKLRHGMVSADSMRSFLIIGAGFCLMAMYGRGKTRRDITLAILGLIMVGDLYAADKRWLDHESFCSPQVSAGEPFTPTEADLHIMADTTMHFRVMNIPKFMQADPSYFYKNIGGYHAAKLTRYQDMIDRHLGHFMQIGYVPQLRDDSVAMAAAQGDTAYARMLQTDLHVLDMLNARYVVDQDGSPKLNPYALGNAWLIDSIKYVSGADAEMAALDLINPAITAVADDKFRDVLGASVPASCPGDTIYLTSYAPNRLTYRAESRNGGVAVMSEVYFPWGWHVSIDGEKSELGRVDYLLRAVRLPAGSHTVTMWFDPESLHVTNGVATASVIIIYLSVAAGAVYAVIRRRRCCGATSTSADEAD